jgi:hypothetical protein
MSTEVTKITTKITTETKPRTFEERVLDKMRAAEVTREQAVALVQIQDKRDALNAELAERAKQDRPSSPRSGLPEAESVRRQLRADIDRIEREHATQIAKLEKGHKAEVDQLSSENEALKADLSKATAKETKPAKA